MYLLDTRLLGPHPPSGHGGGPPQCLHPRPWPPPGPRRSDRRDGARPRPHAGHPQHVRLRSDGGSPAEPLALTRPGAAANRGAPPRPRTRGTACDTPTAHAGARVRRPARRADPARAPVSAAARRPVRFVRSAWRERTGRRSAGTAALRGRGCAPPERRTARGRGCRRAPVVPTAARRGRDRRGWPASPSGRRPHTREAALRAVARPRAARPPARSAGRTTADPLPTRARAPRSRCRSSAAGAPSDAGPP